jgi:hypothetical protein
MTILSLDEYDPNKTIRHALPYTFHILMTGKLRITNTRGQILIVSRSEVDNILAKDDLDPHRRRMYEAAKAAFEKLDAQTKAVQ